MTDRLRVTWTVEYENNGGPMPDTDGDEADWFVALLMDHGPQSIEVDVGPDEDDTAHLDPVAWSLDAGPYGDLHIGEMEQ